MASPIIPSPSALRALRASLSPYICPTAQVRHATLLRRPKRPYTFTQLITLSDGSAFTLRTTNPTPVYKSTKDTRNTPLWNPSSQKLMNVEEDEAGKLAAFRSKFGRGWDADTGAVSGICVAKSCAEGVSVLTVVMQSGKDQEGEDHLLDLITAQANGSANKAEEPVRAKRRSSAPKAEKKK